MPETVISAKDFLAAAGTTVSGATGAGLGEARFGLPRILATARLAGIGDDFIGLFL